MEEQKKEEMEVKDSGTDVEEVQENAGNEDNSDSQPQAPAGIPTRSYMLWVLAGIYLSYTGYRLCKNVMDGVEGASIGFMLSGILFLAFGVGLLFFGVRGVYRADRLKKANEAAQAKTPEEVKPEPEQETKGPAGDGVKKPMSISERARLAGRLEDETEEEADEDME